VGREGECAVKTQKANYVPSAGELDGGLEHVFYEMWQLVFLVDKRCPITGFNNAILESRLTHVRNLLDFFEHPPTPNDDMLCSHFGFSSSRVNIEQKYRDRLNKDLSHLTYSRTRRGRSEKPWPHKEVILPLLKRCRSFAERLLETRQVLGVRKTKAKWDWLVASLVALTDGK
jgi:hypothetical protein